MNELEPIRNPAVVEVEKGNPWYTDDQFAGQLGRPGPRSVVENRWKVFAAAINRWLAEEKRPRRLRVLDAGCGDGINLFGLNNILSGMNVSFRLFGMDYNCLRLGRAARLDGLTGLAAGSLLDMPLAPGSVDVVLCNHALEHIAEDRKALNELYRVIAPGGLLILGVPNEGCALARLRNHVLQPSIARSTDHVQFYTKGSLAERMREAGFQVRAIHGEGFFVPHLAIASWLMSKAWGRRLMDWARGLLPGQAAGLIAVALRP